VGRAEFALMLAPNNRTNLAAGINTVEHGARRSIPKLDTPVGGTASTRQEAAVKGTPVQGLDGGLVLIENETGCVVGQIPLMVRSLPRHGRIPQTHGIIVAPARETRAVVVPFEAAHFLLVVLVLTQYRYARISWLKIIESRPPTSTSDGSTPTTTLRRMSP
jgi:hypothetical protein